MAANTRDLTEGPIWRALSAVSAPMALGIFAVLSVGIADAYFLGRIGATELASVGFIYPVTAAITSLAIGLSAGANAALSQSIGRDDDAQDTNRLALHTLALGTGLGIVVALLVLVLHPYLFALMGAGPEVQAAIAQYIPWWALSFPFLVLMMTINATFRAHGDGARSAIIMVISAAVNVALDPILIFGWGPIPAMEVAGAAQATAFARIAATGIAIGWALRSGIIRTCGNLGTGFAGSARSILKVGFPAAFSNAINPAGMAAVTAAVATLGETAVAGFGAATRVQSLALVPLLALSSGIGPVVGQNWGAKRQDRARGAVWLSWGVCLAYGAAAAAVLTLFGGWIASAIASDADAARFTEQYLRIVGWSLFGYGILVTGNAAMNARSKALWSTGLSLTRIFVVYLPLAWIGVAMFGFAGILVAAVLANLYAAWGAMVAGRATGLLATDAAPVRAPAELIGK
ncbi:MAG: MATE family efflux transporter [Rhodobacteraceae bacterium]|nr:MATE family efflux transporter [Paracoccaceae bacterium]